MFHVVASFLLPEKVELFDNFCSLYVLIEILLTFLIIVLGIITSIDIFFYGTPKKISNVTIDEIKKLIRNMNSSLYNIRKTKQTKLKKAKLEKLILRFTSLTISAIKAKDYEIINNNITTLGSNVWESLIYQLSFRDNNFEKLFKRSKSIALLGVLKHFFKRKSEGTAFLLQLIYLFFKDRDSLSRLNKKIDLKIEGIIDSTMHHAKQVIISTEKTISSVFSDIYEYAFASKEFYTCDKILEFLNKAAKDSKNYDSLKEIINIHEKLFIISLNYKYEDYTSGYCYKILGNLNKMHKQIINYEQKIEYFSVYYSILKKVIDLKNDHLFRKILEEFRSSIVSESDIHLSKLIYRNLVLAGIYCLYTKSMKCYANLLRFVITRKLRLDLISNEYSYLFEKRKFPSKRQLSLTEILDDLDREAKFLNIYSFKNSDRYILLKSYVFFYSYLKLQSEISVHRVNFKYRSISIIDVISHNTQYSYIRTLLLDAETHQKNWDKLFVSQTRQYIIETLYLLLKKEEDEKVLLTQDKYEDSDYIKCFVNKLINELTSTG